MPSSCDNLYAILNQLHPDLVNARHRFRPDFHAGQRPLLARFFRRSSQKPSSVLGDEQLYLSLQSTIKDIEDDNSFFTTFLNSIGRWTDAVAVMPGLESFAEEIEAVIGEISYDLALHTENKFILMNPLKMLQILEESRERIEFLKLRMGTLPTGLEGCSVRHHFSSNEYSVWQEFEKSVQQNLRFIIKEKVDDECPNLGEKLAAFIHKLKFLQTFLGHAVRIMGFWHRVTEKFFNLAAYVVVRAGYQSCHCWFTKDPIMARGRITALLDTQHEIDLTNPEFLEFILQFMSATRKADHNQLVRSFLNYLLKWGNDLEKHLMPLLTYAISTQEESRDDGPGLISEIKAMLLGVGFLHDPVPIGGRIDPSLYSELLVKIGFLKAEAFLMEKLNSLSPIRYARTKIGELHEVLDALPEEKTEYEKQAMELIDEVTMEVPLILHAFQANTITTNGAKMSLLLLLVRIVLFKSEAFLMELPNLGAASVYNGKGLIEALLLNLKLFSSTVGRSRNVESDERVENIFFSIEAVARRLTAFSYVFVANEMTENMMKKMILFFTDSLDRVKLVKTKVKEICPEFPVSHFPKTNEIGFLDFLLQNLSELITCNSNLIAPVKHHIIEIQSHLEFSRPNLSHLLNSDTPELKYLGDQVIHVAYRLDYVIDMIEIGANFQHFWWFYDLLDEMRDIKLQANRIHEKISDAEVHNVRLISSPRISLASSPVVGETVSLNDEEDDLKNRLLGGSIKRDIVSIVGMAGIGKTTLAKKLYNDPNVAHYFHRRAWCYVSQVYSKRELLLKIINDVQGLTDEEIHQMTDADLELKLYRQLKRIRYLIVMDDMWDTEALKDLDKSFPDDGAGSRILITSRKHDVALKAEPDSKPHELRPLSDDESWSLLKMKSFPKGCGCPEELVDIGKEIAGQCKGLPLAIVAIAGILERAEKKQDHWENIAANLNSRIISDPETRCKEILEMSYMYLPCHLKACFLYFGSFSEDKEVPVTKLIRLWIAEGFIENNGAKSLEDVSEDYLMDLIDRSLVMISKRKSNGRVKACSMHDLFRDLCLSKAKQDNFLQLITRYHEPFASFDRSDYGFDFYDFYPSDSITYECHRLCICLKRKHFVYSKPSGPYTRSLIFSAHSDTYPRRPFNVSFICQNFKLLRVLDLECINMGMSFPAEIEVLIQLRYLAVSGDMDCIPGSINKLRKLETFILKGLSGKVVLPDTIWSMTRLRHLHVNHYAVFSLQDGKSRSISQLNNLVSLSLLCLSHGKDAGKIIKQLPNLSKLSCIFHESWDSSKKCNQFPRLESLTKLESLKIIYFGEALSPVAFSFPSKLKKLTLSNFRLPWDQICAIGALPNLEVLKLLFGAFEGKTWEMKNEDEFRKLKYLKLDTLNFAEWNASYDDLPQLQHLVLRNCKNLEEVPSEFAYSSTLEMIEVQGCKPTLEESVRIIGGTEGIKVVIS